MNEEPKVKKGAPNKRDQAVVRVAEAMGTTLAADVMTVDEMTNIPDIARENERNQGIMCAFACGYSTPFIAKMFKVAQPTIFEIIKRIDPNGVFKLSKDSKKAFMTKLYESRGVEALSSITVEKLEESSAVELARISKTMADAAANLNQSKHKEVSGSRLDMLMEAMVQEGKEGYEDAEIVAGESNEKTDKCTEADSGTGRCVDEHP